MKHPTAIISNTVKIHEDVKIGPNAMVLGKVDIDAGTVIGANAIVGHENAEISLGKNNKIFSHAYVGGEPQDLTYKQENSKLIIGNGNTFREFTTVNTGTKKENNTTIIGDNCLLMAYVHIGHDTELANNVVVANTSNFAGHVKVGSNVTIGGSCNFSQFIRVGDGCYITGESAVNKDVIPYTIAQGKYAVSRATNKIGLERMGLSKEEVANIHKAIRALLSKDNTLESAIDKIKEICESDSHINNILKFIVNSQKGLAR